MNGDVDNNPQGSSRNADIRPKNQSTEDSYQSLQVCRENPYLRINKRPALQDENVLEETYTSNYEQMRRSQIGDHDDAYQKLGDGGTGSEMNEMPQITDISKYGKLSRNC